MSAGDRAMSWPALWSYRRPFSLDHMQLMLGLEDEDAYPILTELLTNERTALRLPGRGGTCVVVALARTGRDCWEGDRAKVAQARDAVKL